MDILGIRIDNFSKEKVFEKVGFFLDENKFHQIATVNPEFILRAQKDTEFKNILNKCDLNIADGVGISYAFLRKLSYLKFRIAGIDLMQEILQIADEKKLKIFLAIHPGGLSSFEEIKNVLNEKYPNIKIDGGDIDPKRNKKWPKIAGCQIVFCNFGFPQQEKFLNSLRKNDSPPHQLSLNSRDILLRNHWCGGKIRLAVGVGGAFDFVTQKVRRAPLWMRKSGLEWLWRLILEPRYRFKRIYRATVVFPLKVLFS